MDLLLFVLFLPILVLFIQIIEDMINWREEIIMLETTVQFLFILGVALIIYTILALIADFIFKAWIDYDLNKNKHEDNN